MSFAMGLLIGVGCGLILGVVAIIVVLTVGVGDM